MSFDTHDKICVEADPPILGRKSHLRRVKMRGGYSSPRRTRSTLKVHKTQAQLKEDLEDLAHMPWVTEESDGCVTVDIQVHHDGQQTEPLTLPVTVAYRSWACCVMLCTITNPLRHHLELH